ncbi:MAG TPA: SIMPL domain-containing protein [Thermoanaerobaculia bacterium]|nr:SIMPL domain-containing protein [Thermoanaerobaculia bacterium]
MTRIGFAFAAWLALLALPLAAQQGAAAAGTPPLVPVLSVQGTGDARVTPDEATVRLGVFAQRPTAREAQDQVSRTGQAVLEAVRRLGVRPEQIQTSELSLGPVYDHQEGREPRVSGYTASNVVSIRLEDLDQVGPVVDAGLGAGANRLDGVIFGLRDDAAARASALTAAVSKARAKADALARALRVRLVEIVEVTEGGIPVFTPTYARGEVAMAADAMIANTPVSSGQVEVQASVTLRYRIAPCPAQGECR